jgi:hypothetical protein
MISTTLKGFKKSPKRVCVGMEAGCLWHLWDSDKKSIIPIQETMLVGYIQKVTRVSFNDGETEKLRLYINVDDEDYIVQSGFGTWWSRGCLLSLASMDVTDFWHPITISVFSPPASDKKVVFCRIIDAQGNAVKWVTNDANTVNFDSLLEEVAVKVGTARGDSSAESLESEPNDVPF